jgi:hypothetical protein
MSKPLAILLSVMAAVALWFVAGKPVPTRVHGGCLVTYPQVEC